MTDDANTCPTCKQPDVHPRNTTADGLRFRRCPACAQSWFTKVAPSATEGEAT
jgi:formate dehydrogenase maturation protein FdhE